MLSLRKAGSDAGKRKVDLPGYLELFVSSKFPSFSVAPAERSKSAEESLSLCCFLAMSASLIPEMLTRAMKTMRQRQSDMLLKI